MRLGLIGAGRWGKRYIATILQMGGMELAHLASTNPESMKLIPPGCRLTADWREVASNRGLDGIILATPPALHLEMALAAIRGGTPVLVEKPMTLSLADAAELTDAAARHSVLVMADHTHLFSVAYRKLKSESRALGRLLHIRSAGSNWGPFRPDTPMLWDYAPHDIAMCLDLCGGLPHSVTVSGMVSQTTPGGTGAHICVDLEFAGNVKAKIEVSNIDRHKQRYFEATYEKGTLIYDDCAASKLVFRAASRSGIASHAQAVEVSGPPPLSNVLAEFCKTIASGVRAHPSLPLGHEVVHVLTQCQRALDAPI